MKEIFEVKKTKFIDKFLNKISSSKADDKRAIKKLIITDNDIIVDVLDRFGKDKKIIIPVSGITNKIKENELLEKDKMITIKYINYLGRIQYCSFYPGFISENDRPRFLKTLKLIGLIKLEFNT